MFKWIKKNWRKSLFFMALGYGVHILVEAFIVTNILAIFGLALPTIV